MLKDPSTQELYEIFKECNFEVCTDTRKVVAGSLFFALKGENFNANELATKALEAGCLYAVVDELKWAINEKTILVKDTLETLQELAKHHRRQFNIPVLGITGSNGKTTNKELVHAVLSGKYNTLATVGNLNNHIGVPLTLLKLRSTHEFAIIEMGANHQGEIDLLSRIAEPGFGLITNIGKAHLEGFGGIEGVKKGKSELYRFIKSEGGKVFVNGDDDVLNELAFQNDKITYGCKKLYDVIGKDYSQSERVSFKYTTRYGEKDWGKMPFIETQIPGSYNFINCLAAVCVGNYFKVEPELIKKALEEYVPSMNRSQFVKTVKNEVILDAYNANPNSMKAAIENFVKYKAEKKLLLLGDMFELGEFSFEEHQRVVNLLVENRVENVMLVGVEFMKTGGNNYKKWASTAQCLDELKKNPPSGYAVLIKGSRGMKMETLKEAL